MSRHVILARAFLLYVGRFSGLPLLVVSGWSLRLCLLRENALEEVYLEGKVSEPAM